MQTNPMVEGPNNLEEGLLDGTQTSSQSTRRESYILHNVMPPMFAFVISFSIGAKWLHAQLYDDANSKENEIYPYIFALSTFLTIELSRRAYNNLSANEASPPFWTSMLTRLNTYLRDHYPHWFVESQHTSTSNSYTNRLASIFTLFSTENREQAQLDDQPSNQPGEQFP